MTDIEVEYIASEVGLTRSSQIVAHVLPENATDKGLVYHVTGSDGLPTSGLTISETGVMTGVEIGDYIVTVVSHENPDIYADDLEVKVVPYVPVTGIYNLETVPEIGVGKTYQLVAGVAPEDATNKGINYRVFSSPIMGPTNGLIVSDTGLLTGVDVGEYIVDFVSQDNPMIVSSNIDVKVVPVQVDSLNVTPLSVEIEPGQTLQLVADIYPENATNKSITYTAMRNGEPTSVATVDSDGMVTGVEDGSCYVIVRSDSNPNFSHAINVWVHTPVIPVEDFELVYPEPLKNFLMATDTEYTILMDGITPANAAGSLDPVGEGIAFEYVYDQDNPEKRDMTQLKMSINNADGEELIVQVDINSSTTGATFYALPYTKVTSITYYNIPEVIRLGEERAVHFTLNLNPVDSERARLDTVIEIVSVTGDAIFVDQTGPIGTTITGAKLSEGWVMLQGVLVGDFKLKVTANSGTFEYEMTVTVTE